MCIFSWFMVLSCIGITIAFIVWVVTQYDFECTYPEFKLMTDEVEGYGAMCTDCKAYYKLNAVTG